MLKSKIFDPYFISNSTILDFSKLNEERKLSLNDILTIFNTGGHRHSKYYFQCTDPEQAAED